MKTFIAILSAVLLSNPTNRPRVHVDYKPALEGALAFGAQAHAETPSTRSS